MLKSNRITKFIFCSFMISFYSIRNETKRRYIFCQYANLVAHRIYHSRKIDGSKYRFCQFLSIQYEEGYFHAIFICDPDSLRFILRHHINHSVNDFGSALLQAVKYHNLIILFRKVPVYMSSQLLHAAAKKFFTHLFDIFKTVFHMTMNRVCAAATDTVMCVISNQHLPEIIKMTGRIYTIHAG